MEYLKWLSSVSRQASKQQPLEICVKLWFLHRAHHPFEGLEVIRDDKMDEIKHSQMCYHDGTYSSRARDVITESFLDFPAGNSTEAENDSVIRVAWHSILWCLLAAGCFCLRCDHIHTFIESIDFYSHKGHQSNNRFIYCFLLLHAIFERYKQIVHTKIHIRTDMYVDIVRTHMCNGCDGMKYCSYFG